MTLRLFHCEERKDGAEWQRTHKPDKRRLTNGADSHIVAKLLGHVDGRMLHTRYGHVDRNAQFMIDSVNRKRNPLGE